MARRVAFVAALLACIATGAFATSCNQNLFCARWMCEQNTNRREELQKLLGASYNMDVLDECNAQQDADILSRTCTLPGFGTLDIGMRYQTETCAEERPPQLQVVDPKTNTSSMAVQAKSIALEINNQTKTADATKKFEDEIEQCSQPGFKPSHSCVCETGIAADYCIARIRQDVFFDKNSEFFNQALSDRYAGEFVELNTIWNVNLDVKDPTGARPNAIDNCIPHFGMANCQAISPAPPAGKRRMRRRRHLREAIKLPKTLP